jgi:hypothetical protein
MARTASSLSNLQESANRKQRQELEECFVRHKHGLLAQGSILGHWGAISIFCGYPRILSLVQKQIILALGLLAGRDGSVSQWAAAK